MKLISVCHSLFLFKRPDTPFGHSDVADTILMLATFFIMLVILSVLNRSPTSQIGHRHTSIVINTFRPQPPSPT